MAFVAHEKTVQLSRLLLAGTKMSNSREVCEVDVSDMPLPLTSVTQGGGRSQFSIPVSACPIAFDVLNGAVLVEPHTAACMFKEADCQVLPGGLWGPPPGELGPDRVKTIERERVQADSSVRAAYKGLVSSTKDRPTIRGFASDQAGFSSYREETCRDYIGEARHGFCGSRLTQARSLSLQLALAAAAEAKEGRKKARAGAR